MRTTRLPPNEPSQVPYGAQRTGDKGREPAPCHGAAAGHICEGELQIQSEFPGHCGIEETPKSQHHQDLLAWLSGGSR